MNLSVLKNLAEKKIAVIGDICLDLYYHLNSSVSEISVETGLTAHAVTSHNISLGGAGNVALNCKILGTGIVDVFGIVGNDSFGFILKDILNNNRIGYGGLVKQDCDWTTNIYHKIYQNNDELPRYDLGVVNRVYDTSIDKLLDYFLSKPPYDIIIINEQFPTSLHCVSMQEKLNKIIDSYNSNSIWITDCRNVHDQYPNTIHKCNQSEGYKIYHDYHKTELSINDANNRTVLTWLTAHWRAPVIMTLGEDGAIVGYKDEVNQILGTHIIEETDTVGAGDAFLSAFSCGYSCGMTLYEAALLGNISATVCIKKIHQTGNPTLKEITELAQDLDFRYNPEIANNPQKALYWKNSDYELIEKPIQTRRKSAPPKIVIFDHDGTISTLRQGWEVVMRQVMLESITQGKPIEHHYLSKIEHAIESMIEKTTGVQTIIQMHELVKLIKFFNIVEDHEVLDAQEYKDIYNTKLLEAISKKRNLVTQQVLGVEDVTIKGSVQLLSYLREIGATLYLASGTDIEDVEEEAKLLGYDTLFNGGIFGSVGDRLNDPKRVAMQSIINKITNSSQNIELKDCFVFGDGAVEIREGKKHNFFTIGLASDEKQRFGLDIHKRRRLVLAGADMIIPDFSRLDYLKQILGWNNE